MVDLENPYSSENLLGAVVEEQKAEVEKVVEEQKKEETPIEVKVEEPVKVEEQQPVVTESAFDNVKISSKLSEILGEEIKDINDDVFAKISTKLKGSTEKETLLQTKITELQKQIDEKPNYKNSQLARIDKLQSLTGIEDVSVLSRLVSKDVKSMTAFDAIKTAFILDNPEIDSEEDIESFLLQKFNVTDIDELADLSGADKIKLKQEERIAKTKLDTIFNDLNQDSNKNEEQLKLEQQKRDALSTGWKNVGETAKTQIKEINIPIIENGKSSVYMTYALKDAESYFDEMVNHLASNGKELTEENLKEGFAFMENRYFLDHKAEIISSAIAKERSAVTEEYDKKYANVVPLGSPVEKGSGDKPKSNDYEKYLESL
jgi:hypothetical protein